MLLLRRPVLSPAVTGELFTIILVINTLGVNPAERISFGVKIFTPFTPPNARLPLDNFAYAPVLNSSSCNPYAFVKFLNSQSVLSLSLWAVIQKMPLFVLPHIFPASSGRMPYTTSSGKPSLLVR